MLVPLCDPVNCSPPGSSVHGDSPRQEYWRGLPCPPPGDLPNLGIKPRSPALQADSLPSEPPGKPKNAGVGSPSLLQQLFLAQESNWGPLHCRRILYQLSYQGSPKLIWSQALLPWRHPSLRNWSFPLLESQPQYIEFTVKVVVKKKMVVV